VARRFDSAGGPRGSEFRVNTYTEYSQGRPAIACEADGDFVVVWDSDSQDGDGYGVFGQRIDKDGIKAGTEFQINAYVTGSQQLPSVAAADTGEFVVVWESYDDQDGDSYGIFGQRFASDGAPNGTEFRVNAYTAFSQQKPVVAADADGDFTVAWSSPSGEDAADVFARHFQRSGVPIGTTEFLVNTYTAGVQGALSTVGRVLGVAQSNDRVLIVWQSTGLDTPGQDGDGSGVFAQRYTAPVGGCTGDCNGDGRVTVDELIRGIRIGLLIDLPDDCPAMDGNRDGNVAINELVQAVNNALQGCI
jgi:hypothetical protein